MTLERQFGLISYLAVFCGFFALWISGTFGVIGTVLFITAGLVAWNFEGSRWQISERIGTVLVVLALPFYYLIFRFGILDIVSRDALLPAILARLILTLTAIKLLQRKTDRDWMFLFLMAFFEVLLAAGLSISLGYLGAFVTFVFVMGAAIIAFQIRKSERLTLESSTIEPKRSRSSTDLILPTRRLLAISALMVVLISVAALPIFFLLPRVSGAGLGGNMQPVSTMSGFSDTVKLGGFGKIQQNDAIVMRVRVENEAPDSIHWRGVALDTFDGTSWSRSKVAIREPKQKNERDLIQVDNVRSQEGLTLQTVYLEPLDAPVIFGLYRMIGIQGNFQVLYRDAAGAITFQRTAGERVNYKVLSDAALPPVSELRSDRTPYSSDVANYLQLPRNLDPRVDELASVITSKTSNRYDSASAVEEYLQTRFGYSLEQTPGGDDPLADFLFNVHEGHCEYFATAMAIMLRTQGIAARVVNGFQRGEYNDAADVYVVRQRNAHSWVEVYFPETDTWVTFDPTPPAAQNNVGTLAGFSDRIRKYTEALETFWIQYFVAFDNQEQRSLFVSVKRGFSEYESGISSAWGAVQSSIVEWWRRARGDEGMQTSISSIGFGALVLAIMVAALLLVVWAYRKIVKSKVWILLWGRFFSKPNSSAVGFYQKMQRLLAGKGLVRLPHQTPLEFAHSTGISEAVLVTERYNQVRYGELTLRNEELAEIEEWIRSVDEN